MAVISVFVYQLPELTLNKEYTRKKWEEDKKKTERRDLY